MCVCLSRMSELDALQEFLQSATAELNWLNEKEQVELARDWADPHINLPAVQHYYEVHPPTVPHSLTVTLDKLVYRPIVSSKDH